MTEQEHRAEILSLIEEMRRAVVSPYREVTAYRASGTSYRADLLEKLERMRSRYLEKE